jgi:hypothetical protein
MWIPDMPNVPPQNMPVMIAQANQAQAGDTTKICTFGICSPKPNHNYSLENVIEPIGSASDYLQAYENRNPTGTATVTILQQPKHGVLRLVTQTDVGTILPSGGDPVDPAAALYFYLPDSSYVGNDIATIQVDFGGVKVNVKYFFQAVNRGGLGDDWAGDYCSKTGVYWKISSNLDANGTSTITSVDYKSPTTSDTGTTVVDMAALASTLGSTLLSTLSGETTGVTVNLAPLTGGAIGQTTGTAITLDTNAAGYNWFIDATPADNSEFLPTSNPNEGVAKAGSAAAGKMDMLSVLLHEYGHALGIDHSANGHDFMATTLTAGVRRLPGADELALMQQLIAQAKGDVVGWASAQQVGMNSDLPGNVPVPFPTLPLGGMSLAFAGLLRGSRYGGLSIEGVLPYAPTTQYAVAANAAFITLDRAASLPLSAGTPLAGANLDTVAGWNTQGSVDIAPASTGSTLTASPPSTKSPVLRPV